MTKWKKERGSLFCVPSDATDRVSQCEEHANATKLSFAARAVMALLQWSIWVPRWRIIIISSFANVHCFFFSCSQISLKIALFDGQTGHALACEPSTHFAEPSKNGGHAWFASMVSSPVLGAAGFLPRHVVAAWRLIWFLVSSLWYPLIDHATIASETLRRWRSQRRGGGRREPWWEEDLADAVDNPFFAPRMTSEANQSASDWAIVTGANSGIGFEVAFELARAGLQVVLACRSAQRGSAAADTLNRRLASRHACDHTAASAPPAGAVHFMPCDLSSFASIRAFAVLFEKRFQDACCGGSGASLRVIVCNAGAMATEFETTNEGFESQFGTHVVGHALLVRLLLPLLANRAANGLQTTTESPTTAPPATRVVVIGSATGDYARVGLADFEALPNTPTNADPRAASYNKFTAYSVAKRGCKMLGLGLAAALRSRLVSVNVVHPGCVSSNIVQNIGILNRFPRVASIGTISAHQSAAFVVPICLSSKLNSTTGRYFHLFQVTPDTAALHREEVDLTMSQVTRLVGAFN